MAAHAIYDGAQLYVRAAIGRPDGSELLEAERRGNPATAEAMGIELAEELLAKGADRILADCTSA